MFKGTIASAPVTVQSGGTLSGTGTIGNVTNSGTVSPGNSPGTLNVVGSYTQTSQRHPPGRNRLAHQLRQDQCYRRSALRHSGTASLNGTVTPVLLNGYRPPVNTGSPASSRPPTG